MNPKLNVSLNLLRDCFKFSDTDLSSVKIDLNKNTCEVLVNGSTKSKIFTISKNVPISDTSEMDIESFVPSTTSDMQDIKPIKRANLDYSETSDMLDNMSNMNLSATSDNNNPKQNILKGGKQIFKTLKYSDTSSVMLTELSNYSNTSQNTFTLGNNKYSETSPMEQLGGKAVDSDTLNSISELRERKSNSIKSNLNIDIFRKSLKGGSVGNQDLSQKLAELGINSSSTSSICE